jgi:cytochrome c-type biogenesis protein CcmF
MQFEGEHLLPGRIGHFFVILAFVASIISTIAYFIAAKKNDLTEKKSWLNFARVAFTTQLIAALHLRQSLF